MPVPNPAHDSPVDLAALLDAVATGDEAALADLYRRTSAKLFGVCLRILKEQSEAEEVLQETYITVWHRAGTYDPAKAGVISWLVAVARNKALDRVRSGKVRRLTDPLEDGFDPADPAPSALAAVESEDARRALMACLGELDEEPRRAIHAAFLEGATYEQLATLRGVPLGTMKSWIRRGLQKLRRCLER